MKKRAMKKYIPKDTLYCYKNTKKGKKCCKWLSTNKNKSEQLSGYCKYLKSGDWHKDGTTLLWDQCKECGVSDKIKKMKVVKTIKINGKEIKVVDF